METSEAEAEAATAHGSVNGSMNGHAATPAAAMAVEWHPEIAPAMVSPVVARPRRRAAERVVPPVQTAQPATATAQQTPAAAPEPPAKFAPAAGLTNDEQMAAWLDAPVYAVPDPSAPAPPPAKQRRAAEEPPVVQITSPMPETREDYDDTDVEIPQDLISAYGDYAEGTELPREAHEIVFINVLASMLNSQGNTFYNGSIDYSMDMWTLLLSASGAGRSTMVGVVMNLAREAGIRLEHPSNWASPQALYQSYSIQPWGLTIKSEFRELTERLKNPQFVEAKVWLTDRFDGMLPPPPYTYVSHGNGDDKDPITFPVAPRVNILSTSSEAWFNTNLKKEDTTGGFLARWLIFRTGGKLLVPTPPMRNEAKARALVKGLRRVAEIRNQRWGMVIGDDVQVVYDQWYRETVLRFARHPKGGALSEPFWNRFKGYVLKLGIVRSVATSGRFEITLDSFRWAVDRMREIEGILFHLLNSGMEERGAEEQSILEAIAQGGWEGTSRSVLGEKFQSVHRNVMHGYYLRLLDAEKVSLFRRTGKGRPKLIFVVDKFHAKHIEKYPNDEDLTPYAQDLVRKW